MLERLGDLIRERVFWRPRFPEEARPQGSMEGGGFTIIPDMMSLVGCSGDEFAGVLRSLGFRMDKRKKPQAPAPETPAASEIEQASTPEAEATTDAEIQTEPAIETIAEPEVTPEIPEETSQEASSETTSETAPEAEPEMIEVWWPKDTGPFRQRTERKAADGAKPSGKPRQHGKKSDASGNKPAGKPRSKNRQDGRSDGKFEARPPRPEKPIDKDSPFAILGALKEQMGKKA